MEQEIRLWACAEFEMRSLHKSGIFKVLCSEQEGKLEKDLTQGDNRKAVCVLKNYFIYLYQMCVLAWALERERLPW